MFLTFNFLGMTTCAPHPSSFCALSKQIHVQFITMSKNHIKFNENDLEDGDFDAGSSDDEYTEREKYLVKKYKDGKKKNAKESDEEILGFGSDDEDDLDGDDDSANERFEADSDLGSDREDGIPDAKAWGKTKSSFYNTNYVDQDYGSLSVREEESAKLEEQEARSIQLELAKHLKEADFSLDVFTDGKQQSGAKDFKPVSAKTVISKVKADLSGLTTKQKQQLLKKDSPEFKGLVDEMSMKMEESFNELEPIIEELKSKNVPESHPICNFIRLKNQLHLTYATNITFYLLLKASQKPVRNHPILKRLVQLKELLAKLDEKYEEHIRPEVERLLEDLQSDKKVTFEKKAPQVKADVQKKQKKLNIVQRIEEEADLFGGFGDGNELDEDEEDDDEEGRKIEQKMAALLQKVKQQEAEDMDEDDEEMDGGEEDDGDMEGQEETEVEMEKRKITYQISKNKGLTPRRSKEQRNPRVKNREKFRKALKRRKGAIRTVRTETTRYSGEHSGIKSTVRKGIKIKT